MYKLPLGRLPSATSSTSDGLWAKEQPAFLMTGIHFTSSSSSSCIHNKHEQDNRNRWASSHARHSSASLQSLQSLLRGFPSRHPKVLKGSISRTRQVHYVELCRIGSLLTAELTRSSNSSASKASSSSPSSAWGEHQGDSRSWKPLLDAARARLKRLLDADLEQDHVISAKTCRHTKQS